MSETEHYKGKLIPLTIIGNVENTAKLILLDAGIKLDSTYNNTHVEQLFEEFSYEYVATDYILYRVQREDIDTDDDILNATKNDDGTIDFEVRYYNGGCGFSEAVESAVKKMEKQDE